MITGPVIEALLHSQGYAVFTHLGDGQFRPIGELPPWFREIAVPQAAPDGTLPLAEQFPFLQNFLIDAEEVWNANSAQPKNSGFWIEKSADGREIAIEASALSLHGTPILLLQNPQESYQEQRRWLQTARQSRLKHDRLGREIQKKEILLHCIIHDLSQPLSAMRGCFSCLDFETSLDAIHKLAEAGLKQSQLQEQMIRGILEAFSEELASQPGSAQKVSELPDIASTAAEVVKDYAAAFAEKDARIKLDDAVDRSRDWKVVGDESRLRRIFANFVENALRVSPPRSTVVLGILDEGPFVRAYVDDEGPGFPGGPASAPQFSLFGKGKEHGGKAGLGLYFCRITAEQWGGTIGCQQRPEGGARFWFRLPRAATATKPAATPPQAEQKATQAPPRKASESQPASLSASASPTPPVQPQRTLAATWRPLHILLAEDTEVNQELMALMLQKRGHSSVPVKNGREVLTALERQNFDVIVMDHEMPEMSGTEATKAIRENERQTGGHIPIVGVTGIALMGGRDACLAAGMDDCIPKPFQVDELYAAIEGLVFLPSAKLAIIGASAGSSSTAKSPLAYVGGDPKFVTKLLRVFLADSSKKIAAIRRAISRRDAETLASSAHSLAGSAGVFDAKAFTAAARKLEAMGRSADFAGIEVALHSFDDEFRALSARLRAQLIQSSRPSRAPQRKSQTRAARKRAKK